MLSLFFCSCHYISSHYFSLFHCVSLPGQRVVWQYRQHRPHGPATITVHGNGVPLMQKGHYTFKTFQCVVCNLYDIQCVCSFGQDADPRCSFVFELHRG